MKNAIKVKNVTKIYKIFSSSYSRAIDAVGIPVKHKEFVALDDVSLDFKEGECYAILGKNGSGKSTLLKIITGVVAPTSGSVKVDGRISAMLELTSGFNGDLTGIENVYMKALTMGIGTQEIESRMQEIIDFADIGDHINQPFRTYSSGMKARIGFAVAVNVDPDILIVDEVLAVGDDIFKMKCVDKMSEFRREGKTILFVSHSLHTVKAFCTRGAWINKGKVQIKGSLGDVVVAYEEFLKSERSRVRAEAKKAGENGMPKQRGISKRDLVQTKGFAFSHLGDSRGSKFMYGEDIAWEFTYEVKSKDIGELTACFTVRDSEGAPILILDKRRYHIDNSLGVHTVRFVLNDPKLLAGKYLLSGELWELDSGCSFGYSGKRAFSVRQTEYFGTGTVHLDHMLYVDGESIAPASQSEPDSSSTLEQTYEIE